MDEYNEALERIKTRIEAGRASTDPRDAKAAEDLNDLLTVALGEPAPAPVEPPKE